MRCEKLTKYAYLNTNALWLFVGRLVDIQSRLFDLGAAVATPLTSSSGEKIAYTKFPNAHTMQLEKWIDQLDSGLPPLTTFILPVRRDL